MADQKDILQDSLLREIDEELRQERYAKLWKKYGGYIIAAAVAVVIGVAGFKGWQYWDQQNRTELSNRFFSAEAAAGAGKLDDATKAFESLMRDGNRGYVLLARFQKAGLLQRQGQEKEALREYKAITDDTTVQTAYQDLATLMSGYIALDVGAYADVEAGITRLSQQSGPLRSLARELTALAAYKRGDLKGARDIFAELSKDAEAPSGVRARASEMMDVLGS